jgi:hypothetical protein
VPLDYRFGSSFICFLAILSLLFYLNGAPIIDQDTSRYVPAIPNLQLQYGYMPVHGSLLPQIANWLPAGLLGLTGIVMLQILFVSYSMARLAQCVSRTLGISQWRRFLFVFAAAISLVSFAPFVSLLIASEAGSMSSYAIVVALLLGTPVVATDILLLSICAAYHPSTMPITFGLLTIFALRAWLKKQSFLRVVTIVSACFMASAAMDKAAFKYYHPNEARMEASFVGAIILNYYYFVAESACQRDPASLICNSPWKDIIQQRRRPERYQPGVFLWGPDKIVHRGVGDRSSRDGKFALSEFEQISKSLIHEALRLVPSRFFTFIEISTPRVVALFRQNTFDHFYGPYHDWWKESFFVTRIRRSPWLGIWCSSVKFSQVFLLAALLVLCRKKIATTSALSDLLFTLGSLYVINLIFMGVTGTAVSRYHYKAFFCLTVMNVALLWELLAGWGRQQGERGLSRG